MLVSVDKIQVHDPKARRGRGGWRTTDRVLREIRERHRFHTANDLLELLPANLPPVFTTADMAEAGNFDRDTARQIAYCFRALAFFEQVDRTRAGYHYRLSV